MLPAAPIAVKNTAAWAFAEAMNAAASERRREDRRQGDRRQQPRPPLGESWFGPAAEGTGLESLFAAANGDDAADHPTSAKPRDIPLARVHRIYIAARAVVGVSLVAAQVALGLMGTRTAMPVVLVCIAYAVQAITLWLLPRYTPLAEPQQRVAMRQRQWLATIGVDLLAFSALHLLEPAASFNFGALVVLPVLMGGVTTARVLALGTAAGVTLMLLLVAWSQSLAGAGVTNQMLQSGLAGVGLFVITLLAGELSVRLAREEQAARGGLELARQQALLNRLVIEEMADGVLVVDHRQRVRAANPAARALLVGQGLSEPAPFNLSARSDWRGLAHAVARALADGDWPEEGRDVTLVFDGGYSRTLRMRVRFVHGTSFVRRGSDASFESTRRGSDTPVVPSRRASDPVEGAARREPWAMLLLEDVRTAQSRLRQEKLAAMGRVSAGIAHEIRNPLAAISQANALLLEDNLNPTQQRLARMVADNVERLKRLVDDVMEVAPGAQPVRRIIDARAEIAAAAAEWSATVGLPLGTESRLRVELPSSTLGVVFDPEHLRRVLVNLLDNARRHASDSPGAIFLHLAQRDDATAQLAVLSDSEPIAPEVERYLFEPFFSTRSRGSGLGLYICRELCERYDASIEYRARPAAERLRNEFVVAMRRANLPVGETLLPL